MVGNSLLIIEAGFVTVNETNHEVRLRLCYLQYRIIPPVKSDINRTWLS
jgi:hypothetical protein